MRHLLFTLFFFAPFLAFSQLDLKLGMGETYGAHCGIAGQPPQTRTLAEELYKNQDAETLKVWLGSKNAVRQVYAVEALLRLGEVDAVAAVAAELSTSTERISTCSGCVYSQRTVGEVIGDILDEYGE